MLVKNWSLTYFFSVDGILKISATVNSNRQNIFDMFEKVWMRSEKKCSNSWKLKSNEFRKLKVQNCKVQEFCIVSKFTHFFNIVHYIHQLRLGL